MKVTKQVYEMYDGVIGSNVSFGEGEALCRRILQLAEDNSSLNLGQENIEDIKREGNALLNFVEKVKDDPKSFTFKEILEYFDNTITVVKKFPKIKSLLESVRQNGNVSEDVLKTILGSEKERLNPDGDVPGWVDSLEVNFNNLLDLKKSVAEVYNDIDVSIFVTAGMKNLVGYPVRRSIGRQRTLFTVLNSLEEYFGRRITPRINHLYEHIEKREFDKAKKILKDFIEDFKLNVPLGIVDFNVPGQSYLEPRTTDHFLIGLYFIINGSGLNLKEISYKGEKYPRTLFSISIRLFNDLETNKTGDLTNVLKLVSLMRELVRITKVELIEEKAVHQDKQYFDNWKDLFTKKLKKGFRGEDIVEIRHKIPSWRSKAVRSDRDYVRPKTLEDHVLSIQYFLEKMYESVQPQLKNLQKVKKESDSLKEDLNGVIKIGDESIELFDLQELVELRTKLNSAIESFNNTPFEFLKLLTREVTFEVKFYPRYKRLINTWLLNKDSLLNYYLNNFVPGQFRLLDWTKIKIGNEKLESKYSNIVDKMGVEISKIGSSLEAEQTQTLQVIHRNQIRNA